MKNKKTQKNRGFTLVETLFAVMILTFTITGLMTIVANSLFSARYAKDEITVNYLLQEVVDYVRNDRDTTVFINGGSSSWNNFVGHYINCSTSSGGCYFDVSDIVDMPNPATKNLCNKETNGLCPFFNYDTDATNHPFYVYDSVKPKTNFQRIITVDRNPLNPTGELILKVVVNWKNGSVPVSRSLSVSFLNWQQ